MTKPNAPKFERLLDILSLKRGHGSVGERKFVEQILSAFNPHTLTDKQGVPMAYVVCTDDASPCLFTAHIDTVHCNTEDAKQVPIYDAGTAMIYKVDGQPLGADDGAGIWLLLEMIEAGIPGTYFFPRGEECGGIGSKAVTRDTGNHDWIRQFKYAIAFDRRDTCSVITHQSRGRCCSDEFANALATLLMGGENAALSPYALKPDSGGVYTDTAEFTDLIPECTNVSIGYFNEHSSDELLDVEYLLWLRDRLVSDDFRVAMAALPVVRDPSVVESKYDMWDWGNTGAWAGNVTALPVAKQATKKAAKKAAKKAKWAGDGIPAVSEPKDEFDLCEMRYDELVRWVQHGDPYAVADLLDYLAGALVYQTSDDSTDHYNNEDIFNQ